MGKNFAPASGALGEAPAANHAVILPEVEEKSHLSDTKAI